MKTNAFFSLIFLFIVSINGVSQEGFPDAAYQTRKYFPARQDSSFYACDAVLQPDGKLVIAGRFESKGHQSVLVVRLLPDGRPDPGFQQNGLGIYALPELDQACAQTILLISNRILLGGKAKLGSFLFQLREDGSPDPGFGQNGLIVISKLVSIEDLASFSTGSETMILAAGFFRDHSCLRPGMVRLTSHGELTTGYGNDGRAELNPTVTGKFYRLSASKNGQVIVCGTSQNSDQQQDALVAKFRADGMPNLSFGTGNGYVQVDGPVPGRRNNATGIHIGKSGEITLCGTYSANRDDDAYVCRLLRNGSLDRRFGSHRDGYYRSDYLNETDEISSLVLQDNGKIIIGGRSDFGGNYDFNLTRLHVNGLPDASFACNSWQLKDFSSSQDGIHAMVVHSDRYLLTIGNSNNQEENRIVVARFLLGDAMTPVQVEWVVL